jgi:hypothetical protein
MRSVEAAGFEPTCPSGVGFKDRCVYQFHHASEGAHHGPLLSDLEVRSGAGLLVTGKVVGKRERPAYLSPHLESPIRSAQNKRVLAGPQALNPQIRWLTPVTRILQLTCPLQDTTYWAR